MYISSVNYNPTSNYRNLNFKANEQKETKEEKKLSDSSKVLIGLAALGAVTLGAYLAGKNHLLGDGIYNFLNRTDGTNITAGAMDKLNYQIQPPIVDKTPLAPGEYLDSKYSEILNHILEDANTEKRFREVQTLMIEDYDKIASKLNEDLGIRTCPMDEMVSQRLITQKRYFSIPENHSEGYCCLDPLLYREARQEGVDIYFGYNILEELNANSESRLLNSLRERFGSQISEADNRFLDECVSKVAPEGNLCCGKNSVLHAYDIAHVGRIFREALGIAVR